MKPLWLVEKEAIEEAIALCNGNIPRAAALLESTHRRSTAARQSGKRERLLPAG